MRPRLLALLDVAEEQIHTGEVAVGFNRLVDGLKELQTEMGTNTFRSEAVPVCLAHSVRLLCLEEPITRHAFLRPRGYPGDAGLIDLYYGLTGPTEEDSERGRALYRAVYARSGGVSVRHRRHLLAACIDDVAEANGPETRALSVACGHFREGSLSKAVTSGLLEVIVCMDQDARSIDLVRKEAAEYPVQPVVGSVRRLLDSAADALGEFHFIYAAGLYDYLSDPMAERLTSRLFEKLRPGGRLLVANFVPEMSESAYMAAFMNWELHYRSGSEVERFLSLVHPDQVARTRIYPDPEGNVLYLDVARTW